MTFSTGYRWTTASFECGGVTCGFSYVSLAPPYWVRVFYDTALADETTISVEIFVFVNSKEDDGEKFAGLPSEGAVWTGNCLAHDLGPVFVPLAQEHTGPPIYS
jgi:hypothetical protein